MSSSPLSSDAALPRAGFGFIFALAGATLMMAGAAAPTLFYPVLQQQIGFSPAMISAIFAIYAVALLASLLVFGSLSDHVGRRIALTVGFGGLAVAVVAFWHANSVATLLSARVVQGLATGILMPALSAVAVDLEPRSRPGSAAIWSAVLPLCGLAGGAFGSGLAMKYGLSPKPEVFGTLAVLYVVLMMLTWALPETSPRHEGVLRALRPRVGLPEAAKPTFWRSAPAVFAGWAIGGLYLSLGTGIVSRVFQIHDAVAEAGVILLLAGTGALSIFLARRAHQRQVLLVGSAALALGTLVSVLGMQMPSLPVYLAGLAVSGVGFGTCFYGTIRSLIPLAHPDERGELFASLYCLSYLAFGVPTVAAGLLVPHFGLLETATGYGIVVALSAAAAWAWRYFATTD
ncbi:MAG: MFS transporter [Rhodobacteraceae bacterium]|nr:MFS transporter [Paracoccaceae bacterium]MAY45846.1 MFS transporter [Paracoccaceae bacterium]